MLLVRRVCPFLQSHCCNRDIFLAPIVFLLLPLFRQWQAPFLVMLGYHLATTYGLIKGTDDFFPHAGLALGVAFWIGTSIAFALPYLLYRPISTRLPAGVGSVVALLVTSTLSTILPPLGLIGWTSPWIGAVRDGWLGILLVVLAVWDIGWVSATKDRPWEAWIAPATICAWVAAIGLAVPAAHSPAVPEGWTAISTNGGHLTGLSQVQESMKLVPEVLHRLRTGSRVVLLPETVAGAWYAGTRAIWQPVIRYTATHPGTAVLVGAAVPIPHSRGLTDALVDIHGGRETILPDRIPVPFSMWHPWQPEGSFRMRVFGKPEVATVDGLRVGYLICYEQLLMWPALDLYPHRIRVLLAPANDWWAEGTDIPAIQRASASAWGRFLGAPVLFAVNR